MSEASDGVERRSVLKHVAAGTAAVAGASGVASASEEPSLRGDVSAESLARYGDPETVRELLAERRDLLTTLAEDGLIDRPSVDALGFDQVVAGHPEDVPGGSAAITELSTAEGPVTAVHVPVETEAVRGRVTLVPERDSAFVALPGSETGDTFANLGASLIECNGRDCGCCRCRRKCGWFSCWTVCQCC